MSATAADPFLDRLRDRAAWLVEQAPTIERVLLFGSRARGDHRRDSDYDVAVVTANGYADPVIDDVFSTKWRHGEEAAVDALVIDARRIEEHGHMLGNLAHELREDAVVLAGSPMTKEENRMAKQTMTDEEMLSDLMGQMAAYLTVTLFARSTLSGRSTLEDHRQRTFQHNLNTTGELWSKSVLLAFDVRPHATHDMGALSKRLGAKEPSSPVHRQWAEAVRSLDGRSTKRNRLPCEPWWIETPDVADERLARTLDLIGEWIGSDLHMKRAPKEERQRRQSALSDVRLDIRKTIEDNTALRQREDIPAAIGNALARLDAACSAWPCSPVGDARTPRQAPSTG